MGLLVEPQPTRHHCEPPKYPRIATIASPLLTGGVGKPPVKVPRAAARDTLWRCDDCRRWWYAYEKKIVYHGGYGPLHIAWARVRWYHRRYRQRIAVAVAVEQQHIVDEWPQPAGSLMVQPGIGIRYVEEGPRPKPPKGGGVRKAKTT